MNRIAAASIAVRPRNCAAVELPQNHWNNSDCQISGQDAQTIVRLQQRNARLQNRLRHAHVDSIMALVAAVEAKDPYTRRHSLNVSIYAERFAHALGLSPREVEIIKIAAVLHDVGKIGLPDSILTKPGKLTPLEMSLVRQHPEIGAAIIQPVIFLRRQRPMVLHHHEWFNGGGYPGGLSGEDIPLGARILHVADSIDAMMSPRTYKSAYSLSKTIDELSRGTGTQFDPQIAQIAIQWLQINQASFKKPTFIKPSHKQPARFAT